MSSLLCVNSALQIVITPGGSCGACQLVVSSKIRIKCNRSLKSSRQQVFTIECIRIVASLASDIRNRGVCIGFLLNAKTLHVHLIASADFIRAVRKCLI